MFGGRADPKRNSQELPEKSGVTQMGLEQRGVDRDTERQRRKRGCRKVWSYSRHHQQRKGTDESGTRAPASLPRPVGHQVHKVS